MKLVVNSSARAIEALTRTRMLSDGFQYVEEENGKTVCTLCRGKGEYATFFDPKDPEEYVPDEWVEQGVRRIFDDEGNLLREEQVAYESRMEQCPNCNGTGSVAKYKRSVERVPCPKDDLLYEDLELHEECGRIVFYAGFTASVDRIVELCQKKGWCTIRADGRGWDGRTHDLQQLPNNDLLSIFQRGQEYYPRVTFVGHPGAAGEGLTLTASPSIVYWSNDFNGNSRIQSEARGHRIGMDRERGGRIIDYIHLPTDEYVLNNLQQKKDLQRQTMTGLGNYVSINEKKDRDSSAETARRL